ncbi:hypothetical protein OG936_28855 [Streptomyces sp. NBC_00846]|uniref:hypothetical protein n=1 Tax=Streptomyces sp. NBC_00846 TaxID=2975849 RepID=UPI003869C457|nr:hypothetical protein OG936_28855 [Streptomyces sp. NBC_00846]
MRSTRRPQGRVNNEWAHDTLARPCPRSLMPHIALVTLVVRDYDEARDFYTGCE